MMRMRKLRTIFDVCSSKEVYMIEYSSCGISFFRDMVLKFLNKYILKSKLYFCRE